MQISWFKGLVFSKGIKDPSHVIISKILNINPLCILQELTGKDKEEWRQVEYMYHALDFVIRRIFEFLKDVLQVERFKESYVIGVEKVSSKDSRQQ